MHLGVQSRRKVCRDLAARSNSSVHNAQHHRGGEALCYGGDLAGRGSAEGSKGVIAASAGGGGGAQRGVQRLGRGILAAYAAASNSAAKAAKAPNGKCGGEIARFPLAAES